MKRNSSSFLNEIAGDDDSRRVSMTGFYNIILDDDGNEIDVGREADKEKPLRVRFASLPMTSAGGDGMGYSAPSKRKFSEALRVVKPFKPKDGKLPINSSGVFSYIFLTWFSPLVWKIFRKRNESIAESDIWQISDEESVRTNTDRFTELWEREVKSSGIEKASVERAWRKFVTKRTLILFLIAAINGGTSFLSAAFLLNRIVAYLESEEVDLLYGIGLTVAMAASEVVRAASFTNVMVFGAQSGARFRTAFMGIMYEKLLKLKNIKGKTNSEVIGIFSVDSYRVYMLGIALSSLCSVPTFFIIAAVYCYTLIQYWTLAALGTFVICAFGQSCLTRLLQRFRKSTATYTDRRVRLIREALNNMKFIKMYAWERPFTEAIREARQFEQKYLMLSAVTTSISNSVIPITPTLASVITISVYSLSGNNLSASTVFAVVGTMNYLRLVVALIPFAMRVYGESKVSMKRLERLLKLEEFSPPGRDCFDENNIVELKTADFLWDLPIPISSGDNTKSKKKKVDVRRESISTFVLSEVNLEIKRGQLIGVCGSVGSGKSSLISAIMGRMHHRKGHLAVNGSLAYAAQEAWIFNATVKENILFGSDYDEKWYNKVVDACCLQTDLQMLQDGDETEIGERGANLSGGQKQRVNIARAVYSNRDVYLLDDPLSAVDVRVGRRLFRDCIKGLLGNKTVLLVTHQLQYLKDCDHVVLLDNGSLVEQGPHDVLINNNGTYTDMFKIFGSTSMEANKKSIETDQNNKKNKSYIKAKDTKPITTDKVNGTAEARSSKGGTNKKDKGKSKAVLVTAEESAVGAIGFSTYNAYIRAGGGWIVSICVALLFVISAGTIVFADWWLSQWVTNMTTQPVVRMTQITNASSNYFLNSTTPVNRSDPSLTTLTNNTEPRFESVLPGISEEMFAIVYAAIIPFLLLVQILVGWTAAKVMVTASNHFHGQCLTSAMKAPMAFFDSTPVGRILNRFTKDVDEADVFIPQVLTSFLRLATIITSSITIAAVVSPWILIMLLPVLIVFGIMKNISKVSIRQIKRLENIARSPLISHVNVTSQGLQTIVALGQEQRFIEQCDSYGDVASMTIFLFDVSMRWIGLRLDLVASLLVIGSSLIFVLSKGLVSPATAGMVLGLFGKNTNIIQFLIQLMNEAEARFTSVERLREYGMTLHAESQTSKKTASDKWPERGSIIFKDVVMKYRLDMEPVLRSVSLDIRPQEKVGVVGRTGAGKSSLAAVLFRLVEITSGHVFIDGEDIADLSLAAVRSGISSIPQDPVLFAGTVRYNIDPFSKYSDEQIWLALEKVHMKEKIVAMEPGLESPVEEGGENFSVGERQLMCLARAVLRSSKILLLDEATANVDTSTDAMIQETIRTCFSHCTVITIAHRLNTVLHSDKIIVMDAGQVMECASPQDLLSNPHSFFNRMIAAQSVRTPSP